MNIASDIMTIDLLNIYHNRRAALLTQHGKEDLLRPVLYQALGWQIERVDDYDTDQLGTFTREIPRAGTQVDAARRKATIGIELSGHSLGLANEGAFVPDPFLGMRSWNTEVVILIDADREIEVVGVAYGHAQHRYRLVQTYEELSAFAQAAGFPAHHLVIRPDNEHDSRIEKGIADWDKLFAAFENAFKYSKDSAVFVENDLRAHCNPTRQAMIIWATENLVDRLHSYCPQCSIPGFWIGGHVKGLLCRDCGAPTREILADVWSCNYCNHKEDRLRQNVDNADPGCCDYCNP